MTMLALTNIALRRGRKVLIERASFQIHAGQRMGVIGANGSGKSSLFAMLLGDLEADDGVFGADVPLPYDPLGPIRLELRARFAMAEREGGIRRMVVANIEARRPPLPARTPLPSAVAALQWEGRRIAKAARALVVPSPITAQRVVGASPGMRTAVLAGPDREIPRLAEPIRMAQQ